MGRAFLWNYIFFPGIIFHELAHYIACILCRVKVHSVKFFGKDEAFVAHETPNAWQAVVINLAPFLLGNYFAFLLLLTAHEFVSSPLIAILYYWFAVSLIFFSFPSLQDSKNAFSSMIGFYSERILKKGKLPERIAWLITLPFVFIPLIFVLGIMLLFTYSFALRIIWLIAVIALSWQPVALLNIFYSIDAFLSWLARAVLR